jgi:hypothetical protein
VRALPQELETLLAYLGLDWTREDVDLFVASRKGHDVLSFMNQFVHKVDKVSERAPARRSLRLFSV